MIVDAHAHVFLRADEQTRAVDELAPAGREAPVEDLLAVMDAAGVDAAVLVPLAAEDDYVRSVVAAHPGRFAGVLVADAAIHGTAGGDPVAALERRRGGFAGVRTQWLGEPGRPVGSSPMFPALERMAELGLVLWTYLHPGQLGLLDELARALPELDVVLNHLGFCPHDMQVDEHGRPCFADPFPPGTLERVVALAHHSRVRVMLSGQYAMSREAPPYRDLDPVIHPIAGTFGPRRMLWATDYPWTRDVPGAAALLETVEQALPGLSPAERSAILGGTALELFPTLEVT
jgi:L-fuconolactonase